jgi:hypothetical protein
MVPVKCQANSGHVERILWSSSVSCFCSKSSLLESPAEQNLKIEIPKPATHSRSIESESLGISMFKSSQVILVRTVL